MIRTLITAAAAFSIFLAGSAINGSASAGGRAPFIVTKSQQPLAASAESRNGPKGTEITEFSSSSARRHRPHRQKARLNF